MICGLDCYRAHVDEGNLKYNYREKITKLGEKQDKVVVVRQQIKDVTATATKTAREQFDLERKKLAQDQKRKTEELVQAALQAAQVQTKTKKSKQNV